MTVPFIFARQLQRRSHENLWSSRNLLMEPCGGHLANPSCSIIAGDSGGGCRMDLPLLASPPDTGKAERYAPDAQRRGRSWNIPDLRERQPGR
jgi:hypothetical protein